VDTALNPDGDITLDPTGSIIGTGSIDEWHDFTWLGGILGPSGGTTVESSSDFKTDGASNKELASNLNDMSPFTELGGGGMLQIDPGVTFDNTVGTVTLTLPLIYCYDPSSSYFINDAGGTLDVQAPSSNPTVIAGNFTNLGTLDVAGGDALTLDNTTYGTATQDLDGKLNLEGDLLLRGAITSSAGLIENSGGGTLKIGDADSGTAGSLALSQGATFNGNVEVTGLGTLTSAASVTNNGTLELDVGAGATLSSYQQTSGGTLKEHAPYAGGNSSLTVTGSAQLAGDMEMDFDDGYQPQSGDAFTVLTAGSIGGHFDQVPADMTADYGSNIVTLTQN
jgi:hypothetical protein